MRQFLVDRREGERMKRKLTCPTLTVTGRRLPSSSKVIRKRYRPEKSISYSKRKKEEGEEKRTYRIHSHNDEIQHPMRLIQNDYLTPHQHPVDREKGREGLTVFRIGEGDDGRE